MALQLTRQGDTITVKDSELGVAPSDADTSYTVQLLTRATYREIAHRHTKKRPNRRTGQMEDVTDWEAVSDDLIDYIVQGWDGVLDNGAPAPCSRENKLKLDGGRTTALMDVAGLSQIQSASEVKASSFRGAA